MMKDVHYWAGPMICAVCSDRHIAVMPIPLTATQPADGSECPKCHSMSCVIAVADEEPEPNPIPG